MIVLGFSERSGDLKRSKGLGHGCWCLAYPPTLPLLAREALPEATHRLWLEKWPGYEVEQGGQSSARSTPAGLLKNSQGWGGHLPKDCE